MKDKATWSLSQRVEEFKDEFPGVIMNTKKLAQIYKECNVRYKKVIERKGNPAKYDQATIDQQTEKLRSDLITLDAADFHIMPVDESIFKSQDHVGKAWSNANQNIEVLHTSAHNKRTVCMTAITKEGYSYTHISEKGKYFK